MSKRNLKELLVDLLREYHLLSASQLGEILTKRGNSYNKTSVYRSLEQLLAEEEICRHSISTNEAQYELREHHHAHLICDKCGEIQIGNCSYEEPKEMAGFTPSHHHITIFGVCKKCSM